MEWRGYQEIATGSLLMTNAHCTHAALCAQEKRAGVALVSAFFLRISDFRFQIIDFSTNDAFRRGLGRSAVLFLHEARCRAGLRCRAVQRSHDHVRYRGDRSYRPDCCRGVGLDHDGRYSRGGVHALRAFLRAAWNDRCCERYCPSASDERCCGPGIADAGSGGVPADRTSLRLIGPERLWVHEILPGARWRRWRAVRDSRTPKERDYRRLRAHGRAAGWSLRNDARGTNFPARALDGN